MSKTVKVVAKNVFEFEVDDDFSMSFYSAENFLAFAKQAMMQTPQSILMNDAKYKVKVSK